MAYSSWRSEVKSKYEVRDAVWPADDWHMTTARTIRKFIESRQINAGKDVLLVGSGGIEYKISPEGNLIHLDLALRHLKGFPLAVAGIAEDMPFADNTFDAVACVGSVLNYCDFKKSIQEISRISKNGSVIFLEAETSNSIEYLGKECFWKDHHLAETFFGAETEHIYVISATALFNAIHAAGLAVKSVSRFHTLTSAILRASGKKNFQDWVYVIDAWLSKVPYINKFAGNIIVCCVKI